MLPELYVPWRHHIGVAEEAEHLPRAVLMYEEVPGGLTVKVLRYGRLEGIFEEIFQYVLRSRVRRGYRAAPYELLCKLPD